ncbi:sugar O-acetyltransferase [Bifidobacterium sp. ESL0745]|uniref:sugar O-acetyltransferase n=1 Tax=Bifidobacterium sp. ESL0745 TaxID=2983226 RepID=UPI0023F8D950|nr:sugar O-acetyltransferase [Bifidobacterium sp. ESL0745]MDF7664719.1 sugar O-acetyltransferase [Bifidobacterium sp. ESL0745]
MRTMHERMEEGLLFTDECEGLPEERLAAKQLMREFNVSDPSETEQRVKLLAKIFHVEEALASTFWIEPPFSFAYGSHISIGEGTYINVGCTFIDDGKLEVGKRVMFGPNVTIATVSHPINPEMREYMYTSPVSIGDDCWIGAGVTICPGVNIGDGTTIGAGSVVTKDIPDHVVAVGNPCRVLRKVSEQDMTTYNHGHPIDPADLAEERQLRNS